jgi:dihydrodipicolinate synthase/N-acetylneuraminate lyase
MLRLMPRNSLVIRGIVPIVPTPFQASGEPDWAALSGLIDFAAATHLCAVCLPAYASEFYKLTPAEHERAIAVAIEASRGRIPVIGQVNTPSLPRARELAATIEGMGAAAVNVAVPRLFGIGEANLYRYFEAVLERITVPLVIQDFNPGGASIGVDFIVRLNRQFPHFRYVKLEEPMMSGKVRAIREATSDAVGVIEGWGGMYLPELIPAGICGVMPGLAVADILAAVWDLSLAGDREQAFDLFSDVLPQIVYSLQNMEFFHHAEKLLLQARGILPNAVVRDATLQLNPDERRHVDFLNARVLRVLDHAGLPHNPAVASPAA